MSEVSTAPDLEDVRAELVDAKGVVDGERDRSELNLAISALDAARDVDGHLQEFCLRDCQHHSRAVARRLSHPGPAGKLLGTARMVEEVMS